MTLAKNAKAEAQVEQAKVELLKRRLHSPCLMKRKESFYTEQSEESLQESPLQRPKFAMVYYTHKINDTK